MSNTVNVTVLYNIYTNTVELETNVCYSVKPILNWANVCLPSILRTVQ